MPTKQMATPEKKHYDVGIMGFWFGANYGSILTYYALNRTLESLGKTSLMIEKPISANDWEVVSKTNSRIFAQSHYNISEFKPFDKLNELNDICDTFILGSDQVFNPGCYQGFKNALFFDFVNNDKRKIAYGASFGHSRIQFPFFERAKVRYFLSKFVGVSVRESSGLDTLKDLHIKGKHVLDPIFICPMKYYDNLLSEAGNISENNYVLNYILDPTEAKRDLIKYVSSKLGKGFVNILDGVPHKYENNKNLLNLENTKPQMLLPDFVSYYKNSDFVITDSFHGTCIAILFKKPFIAIANRLRGITRFESLLNLLNLKDRLVYKAEDAIDNEELLKPIDYDKVYEILEKEKAESLQWLQTALTKEPDNRSHGLCNNTLEKLFRLSVNDKYIHIFKYCEYWYYKLATVFMSGDKEKKYKSIRNRLHDWVRNYRKRKKNK